VIAFMQGRLKAAYKVLNDELADKDWLVGDRLTIADLSPAAAICTTPNPSALTAEWPHIDAWLTGSNSTSRLETPL
jgi:glutathione S-transferase